MQDLIERLLGRPFLAPDGDGGEPAADAPATEPASVADGPTDDDAPEADGGEDPDADGGEGDEIDGVERKGAPLTAEELAEVDFGTNKFKVSKELKGVIDSFKADVTRKTQSLSEQRRALEAEAIQQATVAQERISKAGQLANADDMLRRYQTEINWTALEQSDRENPGQNLAQTRMREMTQWQLARDNLSREVASLDAQAEQGRRSRALEQHGQTIERIQQAAAVYHRDIPNWGQISREVMDYGVQQGFTPGQLGLLPDRPQDVILDNTAIGKALYKSYLYDKLAQKQKTAAQQRTTQPNKTTAEVAPLQTVAGRNGGPAARVSLDKANMDQYVATRKKQMEQKQARR